MNPPTIAHPPAGETRTTKSVTRYIPAIARVLMGLPLVVFGLNCFLNFIPPPSTPLPEGAMAFAGALVKTGYMMQLIGLTQLIVGVFLLTNRFVPLALVLFAPFIVNSIAFHLFLERSGLPMAGVFLALELYLAWVYRAAYRALLTARFTP
ncbi:MAG: DoxX family protein [Opitutaceae bacterium]|nr:DoxX family protein [Opitutaceae bacterium]